jgi:enoyl-CoA hydratase
MEYQNLSVTIENEVAEIMINRPSALNALNGQTMKELEDFFSIKPEHRKSLKGVVITGSGDRAFVAGADIKEFLELDGQKGHDLASYGQSVFSLIENYDRPVIAAVDGFALGGGCELAMACHIRVGDSNAKFGQPEVNLGIIPGYGGTQRLVNLIGKGRALEWMLTAQIMDAEEAYRVGLLNHLVEAGKALEKSKSIIEIISQKAPLAIAGVIEVVNQTVPNTPEGYNKEAEVFGKTADSRDFKEGATAFLEKRKPNFKGF